jgi:hypothetical protein
MDDLKITINIGPDAVKAYFKRLSRPGKIVRIAVLLVLLSYVIGYSFTKDLVRTYVFADGDVIFATQINKNFNDLKNAVDELLGDTPNVGVEWFNDQLSGPGGLYDVIWDGINTNKAAEGSLGSTSMPLGVIVMIEKVWSSDPVENPLATNWDLLAEVESSETIYGRFIMAAGASPFLSAYVINTDVTGYTDTHDHTITHNHSISTIDQAGEHNHKLFEIQKYRPPSGLGMIETPWDWIVYDSNGISIINILSSAGLNNPYGYTSYTSTYLTMGINLATPIVSFGTDLKTSFYTSSASLHGHNITLGASSSTTSGTSDNIPPYHALNFIRSK